MGKQDHCPCGSGKPFLDCCGNKSLTSKKMKQIAIWGGIFIVTGVLTTFALSDRTKESGSPIVVAETRIPVPWEYNSVTNQHYDPSPGHGHWHSGPPPANAGAQANLGTPTSTQPITLDNGATITPTNAPPGFNRTGQPWEYDATFNRHWDPTPGHVHWHDGPPPASYANTGITGGGSSVSGIVGGSSGVTGTSPNTAIPVTPSSTINGRAPEPWEYDAENDRHWDPTVGHQHWHSGPPPKGG